MHSNQKLTKIIAGRTITGTAQANDQLTITFDDGSVMVVKTAPSSTNTVATGSKILKVQQQANDLVFLLDVGGSIDIKTADASSSVFMRDKAGAVAYAG